MNRHKSVNIMGIPHKIIYCEQAIDVDPKKREPLWGHIDQWTCTIRVYAQVPDEVILQTIIHEVLHQIADNIHLEIDHGQLDEMAGALADTFTRNKWL